MLVLREEGDRKADTARASTDDRAFPAVELERELVALSPRLAAAEAGAGGAGEEEEEFETLRRAWGLGLRAGGNEALPDRLLRAGEGDLPLPLWMTFHHGQDQCKSTGVRRTSRHHPNTRQQTKEMVRLVC